MRIPRILCFENKSIQNSTLSNFSQVKDGDDSIFSQAEPSTPLNLQTRIKFPKSTFSSTSLNVRKMTTPSGFRTRQTFKLPPRPIKKCIKKKKHSNKLKLIIQKADNYLKESFIERQSQRKSRSVNPRKKYKRPSWLRIQDSSEVRNSKLITLYSSTTHEIDHTEAEAFPLASSGTSHDTSVLGLSYQKNQHTRSESFGSQSSITGRKTEKKRSRFMNKPAGVDPDEVLEESTRRSLWAKNIVSNNINHIKLTSLFHRKR